MASGHMIRRSSARSKLSESNPRMIRARTSATPDHSAMNDPDLALDARFLLNLLSRVFARSPRLPSHQRAIENGLFSTLTAGQPLLARASCTLLWALALRGSGTLLVTSSSVTSGQIAPISACQRMAIVKHRCDAPIAGGLQQMP